MAISNYYPMSDGNNLNTGIFDGSSDHLGADAAKIAILGAK